MWGKFTLGISGAESASRSHLLRNYNIDWVGPTDSYLQTFDHGHDVNGL